MLLAVVAASLTIVLAEPVEVLPRESATLVATWRAKADLPSVRLAGNSFAGGCLALEIKRDGVSRVYREFVEEGDGAAVFDRWAAGRRFVQRLVLNHGRFDGELRWDSSPFPEPGSYSVRLRFDDPAAGLSVASNAVTVRVAVPQGGSDDEAVFLGLRQGRQPYELFLAYPESRYFAITRIDRISLEVSRIFEGKDPLTNEPVQLEGAALREWQKRETAVRVPAMAAEGEKPGGLAAIALERAANLAGGMGDHVRERELRSRLSERYPDWALGGGE